MCGLGLALLALAAIYGDRGWTHLSQLRAAQHDLEQRAFELQQRNQQLRDRLARLRSDDRYLEKLARERLGMVKKGELVYRVLPGAQAPRP